MESPAPQNLFRYNESNIDINSTSAPTPSISHSDSNNNSNMMSEPASSNMVIVGILIGFIIFLCLVLAWVALPPIIGYIRKKMPVSQKRISRRYATVDGWLISKVSRRLSGRCFYTPHQLIISSGCTLLCSKSYFCSCFKFCSL
jgi:hypothetical protein